ncbi:hypothetical protein [Streptomyces sp. NPDC000878]
MSYVAQTSDLYVLALAEDALRLVASDDADTVATIWECATGSYHRLDCDSVSGLDWFQEIADICESGLAQAGTYANVEVGASVYSGLIGRVTAEIDELDSALSEAIANSLPVGVPGVVSALRECASNICPELAFRVLLRVIMECSFAIDRDRYSRFVELGQEFSYGEFVVSRISFLVG